MPFNEKAGALAPMGSVGCSSVAVAIEVLIEAKSNKIKNRMAIFFEKVKNFAGMNCITSMPTF